MIIKFYYEKFLNPDERNPVCRQAGMNGLRRNRAYGGL
jgi:hypothetical protein